jgi:hypothetical protein
MVTTTEENLLNDAQEAFYGKGLELAALALADAARAMRSLLDLVALEHRRCRYCGAEMVLVQHHRGNVGPYDYPAGTSHFATCPQAGQVKAEVAARRARANQPERERAAAAAAGAAIAATAGGGLVQLPPEPQQQSMFGTPIRGAMR